MPLSRQITTISGDTWDILARRIWGDEKLMHKLLEQNPEQRFRVIFPAGVVLTVPDVEISPSSSAPPWRR